MARSTLFLCVVLLAILGAAAARQKNKKQICAANINKKSSPSEQRDMCIRSMGKSGWVEFCRFKGDDPDTLPADDDDKEDAKPQGPKGSCVRLRVDQVRLAKPLPSNANKPGDEVEAARVPNIRNWKVEEEGVETTIDGNPEGSDEEGLDVVHSTWTADVKHGGKKLGGLRLRLIVFKTGGTLTWMGESFTVKPGTFKFTVDVQDFAPDVPQFNDPTNQGKFVRVGVTLVARDNKKFSPLSGFKLLQGNGGKTNVTSMAKVAGFVGASVPADNDQTGTPLDTQIDLEDTTAFDDVQGNMIWYTFPLFKSDNTRLKFLRFDPVITLDDEAADGPGPGPAPSDDAKSSAHAAAPSLLLVICMCLLGFAIRF